MNNGPTGGNDFKVSVRYELKSDSEKEHSEVHISSDHNGKNHIKKEAVNTSIERSKGENLQAR